MNLRIFNIIVQEFSGFFKPVMNCSFNRHEFLDLPIPEDEDIIAGIALGYASDAKVNEFRSSRMDVKDILKIIE